MSESDLTLARLGIVRGFGKWSKLLANVRGDDSDIESSSQLLSTVRPMITWTQSTMKSCGDLTFQWHSVANTTARYRFSQFRGSCLAT